MSETNGHSVSYSGGTPSPQVQRPQTEAQAEKLLSGQPLALGYKASVPILSYYGAGGVPVLNQTLWADVELMLTHPAVFGPLSYYKAGIANVEFEIQCKDPAVAAFVEKMLRRFWERSLAQVQRAYEYGWMAAEICYCDENGTLAFDTLFDFHPLDVYALTHNNRYCGVSVHNVEGLSGTGRVTGGEEGSLRLWGPYRFPAKAFWFAHNRRYQRFYGQSQLYAAWRPWRRLAFRDGLEESLDGGIYRFLYGGWQVYYPPEDFPKQDGGIDYTAARNMARQFAEQAKTGAGLAIPNSRDDKGYRKWEFERPEILMNFDPALNIVKYLKDEISYGIGVPPELLQASETGSGWSGRKVPLIGFYTTQLSNARGVVSAWKVQIGDPLVRWNFGPGIAYEIEVKLVLPAELAGQQGDAGSVMGQGQEVPQPGQAPQGPKLQPYIGPRGGHGMRNPKTGKVRYVHMGTEDGESLALAVERAAQEIDPNPTEAQKKSGNYRKGHVTIQGLPVVIENARGSTRSGADGKGKPWSVTLAHHYGYVGRSKSKADGDAVDVFIGPDPASEIVYVVNQNKPDGSFDEHKAMLGFHTEEEAKQGYLDCHSPGWKGLGEITPMTMRQFKCWIHEGKTGEPTPGQTITLSLSDEEPSDQLAQDAAERVLDEAIAGFAKLARRVRRELLDLARRGPLSAVLARARKLLESVRPDLVRLLTDTQLAAVLVGMQQVGRRIKAEAEKTGPTEATPLLGPSWFGDAKEAAEPAVEKPSLALPIIDEAVQDLRQRRLLTRTHYDQLASEAKMEAFNVAGVESEKLLGQIRDALANAVEKGQTLQDFHDALADMTEEGSVLAPAHAETVFRQHVQQGYSNGQDKLLKHPLVDELFPFAAVFCIHDDRVRPEHLAMETRGIQGTNIYYRDDPVFQLFKGPWDWNCRCGWTALSVRDAAAKGIQEAKEWLEKGMPPLRRTFVEMPPWRPSPEFQRIELGTASEEPQLLKLPDIRQEDDYSCGAAVTMAVGRFFDAGPERLAAWKAALHTTEKDSTRPATILSYLSQLGLQVEARPQLTIADLKAYWLRGWPVICPIQEYGVPSKQASFRYGHYVAVVGVALGQVFVFDPSIDNVFQRPGGDVPKGKPDVDADQTPGLMPISEKKWLEVWHDEDADGNKYVRFGIAVGPKFGATLGTENDGSDGQENSLDPSELAHAYAELWNGIEAHGGTIGHEDLLAADGELCGTDWHLVKTGQKPWRVLHTKDLEGIELAHTERAPKGGVVVNGKFYRGGQFIPKGAVEQMTSEQLQKLREAQAAQRNQRIARGDVDVDALRARLGEHGHQTTKRDLQTARKSFQALYAFHQELTLHRIEELEQKTRQLLAKPGVAGSMLERQLRRRLAWYHAMIDYAEAQGLTGKAPAPTVAAEVPHAQQLENQGGAGAGGGVQSGQPVGERTPEATGQAQAQSASATPEGEGAGGLSPGANGGRDESGREAGEPGHAAGSGSGSGEGATPGSGAGEPGSTGGVGAGGGAGGPGGGHGESPAAVVGQEPTPETPTDLSAGNFRYHDTDFATSGLKAKFKNNLAAIKTLKSIQAEGRDTATPEEQEILSKYVGWGQFPALFNSYWDREWQDERAQLAGLLTDEEWDAARKSLLNAHYTHPDVVRAHWQMAGRLGYKGGRFLETSSGIGYYLGLMPPEMAGKTHSSAVELDKLTGAMAKLLYPKTNVRVQGFQEFQSPDNFYDLVASNVPFGDYKVNDPRYNKHQANIHDYFFLKSLDVAKPGGLVMHITSSGTMDKNDDKIRRLLADKAELVAAIRFPGGAHKENAGTDVVTDMLILRKKDPSVPPVDPNATPPEAQPEKPGFSGITTDGLGRLYHWKDGKRVPAPDWTSITTVPDPDGGQEIPVNRYFAEHPEQILGRLDRTGSMYHGENVNVSRTEDYEERLQDAIQRLPEGILRTSTKAPAERFAPEAMPAPGQVREGGYVVKSGKLYASEQGVLREQTVAPKDLARVEGQLGIRDAVRALFNAQLRGEDTTALRQKLNETYDAFVQQYGLLNDPANRRAFRTDPDSPVLLALEDYDPKTKKAAKSDIFQKDTIRPNVPVTQAGSVGEALAVSLHESGGVDVARMAKLTGLPEDAIGRELEQKGLAFHDPSEGWKPADQYLSGNVRRKLLMAKAAAAADPRYKHNVQALEKVQPEDVDYTEIDVKLGSSWVPPSDMANFAAHLLEGDAEDFHINYLPQAGEWQMNFSKRGSYLAQRRLAREVWATPRKQFDDLFQAALNNRTVTVYDEDAEGNKFVNKQATDDANAKIQEMKEKFRDWIWEDEERRQRLHRYYNDNFNNIRNITYDGSHLTFPGMNPAIKLRAHQKNFVWQTISTGKGLAAHEVGTGKTYTMIAAAMELRRMGLAKKPCIACLKANVEAITKDALKLYPGARILSTDGVFDAKSRKKTISQIATGDYDLIIMTHDNLDMLDMKPETVQAYIRDELDELKAAHLEAIEAGGKKKDNRVVKALEKAKAKLEAKLAEALDASKKDDAVFFEETGIDQLFVDEAHKYKSLPCYTKQDRLKGVPTARSDRATTMQMRTRWLMENNGGRGIVFATGTPVANTMAELYTMQRYLQPEELKQRGISAFDAWASTFGDVETKNEHTVTGEYKPVSRFARFVNIPELMQIVRQVMDVQRADDLTKADGTALIVRPNRKDTPIVTPKSEAITKLMAQLQQRAEKLKHAKPGETKDNMLVICADGRKGSVDMRLVDPDALDDPTSKTNQCVNKVLQLHKANPGVTQLIFSDVGINPTEHGFHLYGDIIDKLIQGGIPRDKIADFSKLEGKKKDEAMAAMRRGEILVGIGSTEKLGTGVNVQNRLAALHHLDVPWLPSSVEQRDGRAWRQGNENKNIDIFRYVSEGSLDVFFWQLIGNKMNFIRQVMTPANKQLTRSAREEDTEEVSAEQMKAIATGDPRVLEKVEVDDQVKQLKAAKDRHAREQAKYQQSVKAIESEIPQIEGKVQGMRQDQKTLEDNPDFALTIDGKTYLDRKEAAEAFEKKAEAVASRSTYNPQLVGIYRGLEVYRQGKDFYLKGAGGTYGTGPTLVSVEAIARYQPRRITDKEQEIQAKREDLERIRQQIGKSFTKEGELQEKLARQKALEEELAGKD